jgi:hypothetical protein
MKNRVSVPALLTGLILLGGNVAPTHAESPCPNAQARGESNVNPATGSPYSTQLPDCRAYELVSPPDTGGYPVASLGEKKFAVPLPGTRLVEVASDGALLFVSRALPVGTGALPNGRSLNVFVSERGSGGWSTTDLSPPATPGDEALVAGAPDGKSALVFTEASLVAGDLDNPLGAVAGAEGEMVAHDLYLVGRTRSPQLVSHGSLPRTVPAPGLPVAEPDDVEPPYVFNAELSAVGFRTTSLPLVPAASASATDCYSWSDVGARSAVLTNPEGSSAENCELLGMTPDGRPIFKDLSSDSYSGEIFVDSVGLEGLFPNGSVPAVQLSAPSSTPTTFAGASPDGSLAYVTTAYPLGGEERGGEPNVYAVTVPALPQNTVGVPGTPGFENTVVCLSCQVGGGRGATFMRQSADGSHVFFEIAEAAGESGLHPYRGLWSWERKSDTASHLTEATDVEQLVLSKNGEYAAGLTRQLANNKNGTADVYEFAASLSKPKLITSGTSADAYRMAGQNGFENELPTAGGVSDDGRRVVYDDRSPPVEGQLPPETVQEWTSAETVEQLSPLGAKNSYYALGTAGPELEDVFFAAHEPLVPADRNAGTQDAYDARVQGGFPPCTAGNPNPPPGSLSCSPPTNTPNPQPPSPSPYTAGLGLAAFSLPLLPSDTSHSANTATPKPLTRAQRLAKALKTCRKKPKKQRAVCERQARRRYAPAKRKGR